MGDPANYIFSRCLKINISWLDILIFASLILFHLWSSNLGSRQFHPFSCSDQKSYKSFVTSLLSTWNPIGSVFKNTTRTRLSAGRNGLLCSPCFRLCPSDYAQHGLRMSLLKHNPDHVASLLKPLFFLKLWVKHIWNREQQKPQEVRCPAGTIELRVRYDHTPLPVPGPVLCSGSTELSGEHESMWKNSEDKKFSIRQLLAKHDYMDWEFAGRGKLCSRQ